jgi:hypothetical protein
VLLLLLLRNVLRLQPWHRENKERVSKETGMEKVFNLPYALDLPRLFRK